eukprot:scaffold493726_cov15-Prasinocladus_malaysianus.AAC.1
MKGFRYIIRHSWGLDALICTLWLMDFIHSYVHSFRHSCVLKLNTYLSSESRHSFWFVEYIAARYNGCANHNQMHAADVSNGLICCIPHHIVVDRSPLEALSAALVAAIINDVDHH